MKKEIPMGSAKEIMGLCPNPRHSKFRRFDAKRNLHTSIWQEPQGRKLHQQLAPILRALARLDRVALSIAIPTTKLTTMHAEYKNKRARASRVEDQAHN